MFFTGHSEHTIDAKQRLAVPAKYRKQWDEARDGTMWYCLPWPDGSLRLFTQKMFKHLSDQTPQSLAPDADTAALEEMFSLAEPLKMDGQGRVGLHKYHLELAGLSPAKGESTIDVVIIGKRNRLEVHDRTSWAAGLRERFQRMPDAAERVSLKSNG